MKASKGIFPEDIKKRGKGIWKIKKENSRVQSESKESNIYQKKIVKKRTNKSSAIAIWGRDVEEKSLPKIALQKQYIS